MLSFEKQLSIEKWEVTKRQQKTYHFDESLGGQWILSRKMEFRTYKMFKKDKKMIRMMF